MRTYRCKSIEWKPSPIVALATSPDDSRVAAARDDGSLEIWLVSPGSVTWHCQLTIHGDPKSRVSSLVWCRAGSRDRLFSSSIDGSVSEWDVFNLSHKVVLESIGVSIWQMSLAPATDTLINAQPTTNGHIADQSDDEASGSEQDSDSEEIYEQAGSEVRHIAIACDDGCVRLYSISDSDEFRYYRSLPRVSGRALSVTWNCDSTIIYSGSSDGLIRCWDAKMGREIHRITAGGGGSGAGPELCVWSLLSLRSGTLVSGDSSGTVQFWDSERGTLLQAHSNHKGDVNALAPAPNHERVFSAGSDGQVILYKLSSEAISSSDNKSSFEITKTWVYVGYVRAHTHDVRALTVPVPISCEDPSQDEVFPVKKVKGEGRSKFTYNRWAKPGVPMLISGGDDTKLFAYSVREFSKFSPHDMSPAPQRVPIQLVQNTIFNKTSLLLVQCISSIDILHVRMGDGLSEHATTDLIARIKSKMSRKITCSAISSSGSLVAYSDQTRPSLFELTRSGSGRCSWSLSRKELPQKVPFAHCMVFSSDCSKLIIAGHDKRIYVVDVVSSKLVHTFTPRCEECDEELLPSEPPITKMVTSSNGKWLAAINCFGDVYVFNHELKRQHWFISRLNGASVAAAGFHPRNNKVLIISTTSNQLFAFDVEAKQLGGSLLPPLCFLPKRFQNIPGEVIGLSFSGLATSSCGIIYSSRANCLIDFGIPIEQDADNGLLKEHMCKKLQLDNGSLNVILSRKRMLEEYLLESKLGGMNNFEVTDSEHPVLFTGYLKNGAVLIIEKPWIEVVKTLNSQPVHRHIFGT